MSKDERTGWRDEGLSRRHRRWGLDCPAVDVDFLLIEYDQGKAVALVEYKNERAKRQYASHPSYRAMIDLVREGVAVFAVRYADDYSWYLVTALNAVARQHIPAREEMTEHDYVAFLYHLRGREMPPMLFNDTDIAL